MATEPDRLRANTANTIDRRRIARLAEGSALAEAQRWFTRERAWINEQHLELCRIAAPTFFEQPRAEWFRVQLESLGWKAQIDRAGNVLGRIRRSEVEDQPQFVLSAHLDTVLAPNRPEEVYYGPEGRLFGPGVSDNGSGLAALIAFARMLGESAGLREMASAILLVANVGEEGEGNLNGMRYLCRRGFLQSAEAFIVLDGPSVDHITAQALASRRFEISFTGPGGHSWNDYGTPNPVHALSEAVSFFLQSADGRVNGYNKAGQTSSSGRPPGPTKARCSYNFGVIEGGSSVNSIATAATAKLDLRSEDASFFEEFSTLLSSAVERGLERENKGARTARLTAKIRDLGARPGGKLSDSSPLLKAIYAVDEFLNIRARVDCASTDANIPLSLGLPAISIGTGGCGGGAHTRQEWYQPEGRDLGLRRILLVLATLADQNEQHPHALLTES